MMMRIKIGSLWKQVVRSVLIGIVFAFTAWAGQDEQAHNKVESGLSAEEILAKAAAKQGGAEIAKNFRSFWADFETWYNHPDKGEVYYQVKRIFQFPSLLWTEKRHEIQAAPTFEVYNGEDGWFIDAEGKVTVYTDKPSAYKTDIENLEEDVRITREMFKNFFIANLRDEINDLKRLSDKPIFKGGEPLYLVSGKRSTRVEDDKERPVYLKIYVDPKEDLVRAVRMIDLNVREGSRLFVFEEFLENDQKVIVPTRIIIYRDEEEPGEPEMKLYINCERDKEGRIRPMLRFNVKPDPAKFNLPEEGEE